MPTEVIDLTVDSDSSRNNSPKEKPRQKSRRRLIQRRLRNEKKLKTLNHHLEILQRKLRLKTNTVKKLSTRIVEPSYKEGELIRLKEDVKQLSQIANNSLSQKKLIVKTLQNKETQIKHLEDELEKCTAQLSSCNEELNKMRVSANKHIADFLHIQSEKEKMAQKLKKLKSKRNESDASMDKSKRNEGYESDASTFSVDFGLDEVHKGLLKPRV
jgi:chromosome segregation ATPase